MARSARVWILVCIVGAGSLSGCRKSEPNASAQTYSVETICLQCESRKTLTLPLPADQENWPKQCEACRRGGRYASGTCAACSAVVPLMEPRTLAYATPSVCPKCGKTWKPAQVSAKPAR